MLNELNLELQGKDKSVVNMISSVNAFKWKKQHLASKLQRHDLGSFQNLVSELETQWKARAQLDIARYTELIDNCLSEFDKCFWDFTWASRYFPVLPILGRCWGWFTRIQYCYAVSPELVESAGWDFYATGWYWAEVQSSWTVLELTHRGKVPKHEEMCYLLPRIALFDSTYLSELASSHVKIVKSKYRSTMTDNHVDVCLEAGYQQLRSGLCNPGWIPFSVSHRSKVRTNNVQSCIVPYAFMQLSKVHQHILYI